MARFVAFLLAGTGARALVSKEFANTFSELLVLSPECSEEVRAILPSKAATKEVHAHAFRTVDTDGTVSPVLDPKLGLSPSCRAQLLENAAMVFSGEDGGAIDDGYYGDYDYDALGAETADGYDGYGYDYDGLGAQAEGGSDDYGYDYDALGAESEYGSDSYDSYDYGALGADAETGIKTKGTPKPNEMKTGTGSSVPGNKTGTPDTGVEVEIMVEGNLAKYGGCKLIAKPSGNTNQTGRAAALLESFVSVDDYEYGYEYDSYDSSLGSMDDSYESGYDYDSYDGSLGSMDELGSMGNSSNELTIHLECKMHE